MSTGRAAGPGGRGPQQVPVPDNAGRVALVIILVLVLIGAGLGIGGTLGWQWYSRTHNQPISVDYPQHPAYTSPDGTIKIDNQNGDVIALLKSALTEALPMGFQPRCTECAKPANPYNGDLNIWQFHTFLLNMDVSSAVETSLFFTDMPVTLPSGEKRPLSERWGFETRVLRPQ